MLGYFVAINNKQESVRLSKLRELYFNHYTLKKYYGHNFNTGIQLFCMFSLKGNPATFTVFVKDGEGKKKFLN